MNSLLQNFMLYSSESNAFIPLLLIVSFAAGVISSLSPCSLGILPLIIGYVAGYSKQDNKRLFIQMLSFSFGLSFVLSIVGVLCAVTGRAFSSFASPVIIILFASVIIILGLNLLGIVSINFPAFVKEMPKNTKGGLFIYPFIVGAFFALASSPCSTPILAAIMAFAAVSNNLIFSAALLFFFAIGQCVIIIAFALFTSLLKKINLITKYSEYLIRIAGVLFIITGFYIIYTMFKGLLF